MEAYTSDGKTKVADLFTHSDCQLYQEMGFRIVGDTFSSPEQAEAYIRESKEMFGRDCLD